MCIEIRSEPTINEIDRFAYKVVYRGSNGSYLSQYDPAMRSRQQGIDNYGTTLRYIIGREIISRPPGIYLFVDEPSCDFYVASRDAILKVLIPKGTTIVSGVLNKSDPIPVLTAEKIKVLERIR